MSQISFLGVENVEKKLDKSKVKLWGKEEKSAGKHDAEKRIFRKIFRAQDKAPGFLNAKKHRPRCSLSSSKTVLLVRLQGLEPWTNRLRVYCSTN